MTKRNGSYVRSDSHRGAARARWLVLFLALFLIIAAVPVLAAEPPAAEEIAAPSTPPDFDPSRLPSAEQVGEAIDQAAREEEEREAWLASSEALSEREASRFAFADLDASGAEDLLRTVFAEQFTQLNQDPARFLSDANLISTSEPTTATVKDDGESLVMESSLPVRAEDEEGDLRKVDLSLEETVAGSETKNALVDVQIPDAADQPVQVGEEGVTIKLAGADESAVRSFGDENRLAFEVLPDTDMLISPIATGVEIFNLLRSENSPETLRFQVGMPEGAVLRADGGWGAEVLSDGELLSTIPKPVAVDAQGTDVPVDLQIEGSSLVLTVDHRGGDYAMPILLDPILENNENWIYGQNVDRLWTWAFNKNVAGMYGSTTCIYHCFGIPSYGRGLFVSAQSGTYWPNQVAQWSYSTPNPQSYISSAGLFPYSRFDHGCNAATTSYKQPHDYFGLWNPQGWAALSVNSGGSTTLNGGAQAAIFGLGSGGGPVFSIPCWRDLYAGGAHIWMGDWGNPWIDSLSGVPTGWVSNETQFTIAAVARDEGLGIKNARIHQSGGEIIYDVPPQNECVGTRRHLCQTIHHASFDLHGGYFFPGERDAWLNANDATGQYTGDHHFTMRVDNTPPEMTLKGEFAEETNEVGSTEVAAGEGDQLSLPVYNLEVDAKDGSWDDPLNKRSGVKDIEIYLKGGGQTSPWVEQSVPWSPQPCPGPDYSCPMKATYPVQLSKLTSSGKHVLKVEAVDQVGKRVVREIEFEYFPATGMKDEYAMHYFPLPDGSGNEAEEEHPDRPELAVNVMNGNLVYREQDIEVEGAGVDLEVERYYNSMLPENEETEWGDGWTLAQTPELDPIKAGGSPVPNQAEILESSGAIEDGVGLPTTAGAQQFDPDLQATLTKKSSGGYELTDETGESPTSVAFDATGQTEALLSAGHAKVDYSYEGGELAEIEVTDPATFTADPEELEIPEPEQITEPTYASAFGAYGTANGQLRSPADVAVDPQGSLWVVDEANNRIQKFDPTGKYLAKFGSLGSGNGQFNRPTSIAIAANGNLLVTDAGNGRVQRFSSTGTYLSKFGSKGTGNGQFAGSGPEGIAIDPAGNIWVSDTSGGRLLVFNSAGAFIQAVGPPGSGAGELVEPAGIDVDPLGNVWAADRQNHRVSVFDPNGEFIMEFGFPGSGDGEFLQPHEIEIDKLGNVWVGDQWNNRVQQFDLGGQFKAQFGFNYPMGIAADSKGHLWIADMESHQIQHWLVPVERPAYLRSFGSSGSGDGQLSLPSDLAEGVEGNLLVLDTANNRIQRFDEDGKYLGKFGSHGTGDRQFDRPTAVAVDRDGNLLVADSDNNRIQKLSPEGEFIAEFGAAGTGNGQLSSPEGIATDFEGNIWVADSGNGRIQRFDEEGNFLAVLGSSGSASGELGRPIGIDVDPEGRVWVADYENHRVSVFEGDGDFFGEVGSVGSEPGQFSGPSAVEIDAHDNVWVTDQVNGRVQRFDLNGQYVGQFGSPGLGEGEFSAPGGIAADREGRIWVADAEGDRIQQWMLSHYVTEAPTPLDLRDGDPGVVVETPGGLVSSVSGNAAGEHVYEHEGDFLTSHDGPEGETLYEKNAAGLLSKVTLPNGTWAKINYYADNRVESVEVAPEGENAKTTNFHYDDGPPRRSTVSPANKPQIVYDIGADGSVLKWWHKDVPPEIIALNGSLGFDKNGTEVPGGDLVLEVEGDSAHGIASIQIIANGNHLVSEKTCEQDPDPEIECERLEDLWVTDTASLSPGVLNIEVIVTNELERSASKRWSVAIPRTPPPVPGYPVPPKFSEIQKFREDYGLEVVFPVANERQLVERIFNLINAWHSPGSPAGEVARASMDRWGVPLRPADVAELEYRESYLAHNGPLITQWGEFNHPAIYAGYYMDHRAGGKIRIGFASGDQIAFLDDLSEFSGVIALDRLTPFPLQPTWSLSHLRNLASDFREAVATRPDLGDLRTASWLDIKANKVRVGATTVAPISSYLFSRYGSTTAIDATYDPVKPTYRSETEPRERELNNRLFAGDNIEPGCTLAFGAWEEKPPVIPGQQPSMAHFGLTAGHCYEKTVKVRRYGFKKLPSGEIHFGVTEPFGTVRRNSQGQSIAGFETDAAAIRLEHTTEVPRWVYWSHGVQSMINGVEDFIPGMTLCYSGSSAGTHCAPTRPEIFEGHYIGGLPTWQIQLNVYGEGGDSGGPVWNPATGAAVGLVTGGPPSATWVTPLKSVEGLNKEIPPGGAPGALATPPMAPALNVVGCCG